MSSLINSDGTIPQATSGFPYSVPGGVAAAISSSTNASPIAITWGAAVPFNDGDTIEIEGHLVNTNANGLWVYQKIDNTHGTLKGSTGNGVGAATGIGIDYAINPLITIPADLDLVDAASVNPAFEALFDTTPFLYRRVGAYAMIDMKFRDDGTLFTVFSTTAVSSGAWTDLGVTPVAGNRYLKYGDVLDLEFTTSLGVPGGSPAVAIALQVNPSGLGSVQVAPLDFFDGGTASGIIVPVTLKAKWVYGSGDTFGRAFTVSIVGKSASATPNIILSGPQQLSIRHYRGNV